MNSHECLLKTFGFTSFRDQQQFIIETIVNQKRDICAVMPTGHGKSICYQLPPIMMEKTAIVISPLLSLMEDQQTNLLKVGIKSCCFNSNLADKSLTRSEILNGEYSIIYITPEMIIHSEDLLLQLDKRIGICLIAIDEAHCISSWGNSFRSSYLELSCLKKWFPAIPILALTGTATPKIQDDIIKLLGLNNVLKIRTSSDRPNLSYYIHHKTTIENDLKIINKNESTIIYCPKRKTTEKLCEVLSKMDIPCKPYHAGMDADTRILIHHEFLENKITCIVATVAFGMGIDKPNIRKVIHYGCPKDIESYVQEIGRAGRDGEPSDCHVYFSQSDFAINRFFLQDIHDKKLRDYKEKMIHAIEKYLYITTCRRAYILEYFGETLGYQNNKCCDNCLSVATNITFNIGLDIKPYLELVKQFADSCGKLMFINVIRGANLAKMPNKLKTSKFYAVDKIHSIDWWKFVVQQLINDELFKERSIGAGYGTTISLSAMGTIWLKTNVTDPTYIITLPNDHPMISHFKPKLIVSNIKPITASTIEILPTIDTNKDKSLSVSQMISYNLFHNEGKSIADIAKIRELTTSTIENHLVDAVKSGLPIKYESLGVNKAKYDEILNLINGDVLKGDTSKLAPIKAMCSADTTYIQIKLVLFIKDQNLTDILI